MDDTSPPPRKQVDETAKIFEMNAKLLGRQWNHAQPKIVGLPKLELIASAVDWSVEEVKAVLKAAYPPKIKHFMKSTKTSKASRVKSMKATKKKPTPTPPTTPPKKKYSNSPARSPPWPRR